MGNTTAGWPSSTLVRFACVAPSQSLQAPPAQAALHYSAITAAGASHCRLCLHLIIGFGYIILPLLSLAAVESSTTPGGVKSGKEKACQRRQQQAQQRGTTPATTPAHAHRHLRDKTLVITTVSSLRRPPCPGWHPAPHPWTHPRPWPACRGAPSAPSSARARYAWPWPSSP